MSDLPAFKKFVSEDELEEQKKKRQEEWEKVRRPDQPLEAQEEEYDPRSLYDRLQEQKDKKQQEYEDAYKLKNQVKGLENDEVEFLEFVSDKQSEITRAREKETEEMLTEYRNAVVSQTSDKLQQSPERKSTKAAGGPSHVKKSQSSLLAGAVKRKGSEATTSQETKKAKSTEGIGSSTVEAEPGGQIARVIGILPGVGAYSSSDSSNSSDSEDSDVDTRMFSKKQVCVVEHRH